MIRRGLKIALILNFLCVIFHSNQSGRPRERSISPLEREAHDQTIPVISVTAPSQKNPTPQRDQPEVDVEFASFQDSNLRPDFNTQNEELRSLLSDVP